MIAGRFEISQCGTIDSFVLIHYNKASQRDLFALLHYTKAIATYMKASQRDLFVLSQAWILSSYDVLYYVSYFVMCCLSYYVPYVPYYLPYSDSTVL